MSPMCCGPLAGRIDGGLWGATRFVKEATPMTIEEQLRKRLRKARSTVFRRSERRRVEAASPAAEPLKAKLDEAARQDASAMKFSLLDERSVRLFVALCRCYGTRRFRYPHQWRTR
jgi:hypothetical protein